MPKSINNMPDIKNAHFNRRVDIASGKREIHQFSTIWRYCDSWRCVVWEIGSFGHASLMDCSSDDWAGWRLRDGRLRERDARERRTGKGESSDKSRSSSLEIRSSRTRRWSWLGNGHCHCFGQLLFAYCSHTNTYPVEQKCTINSILFSCVYTFALYSTVHICTQKQAHRVRREADRRARLWDHSKRVLVLSKLSVNPQPGAKRVCLKKLIMCYLVTYRLMLFSYNKYLTVEYAWKYS